MSPSTELAVLERARVRPKPSGSGSRDDSVLVVELRAALRRTLSDQGVDAAQLGSALERVIRREARLARVAERAGVRGDVEEILSLVEAALAGGRGNPATADPASHFTEAERAELEGGGFDLRPVPSTEGDPAARTVARFAELLITALVVPEVAELLGVDASRIRQRLAERSLYGVKAGRAWRLPRFQFTVDGVVPGIDVVLRRLPDDLHPVAAWRWMTTPTPDLVVDDQPVSPRDWLRGGGDPESAALLAAAL